MRKLVGQEIMRKAGRKGGEERLYGPGQVLPEVGTQPGHWPVSFAFSSLCMSNVANDRLQQKISTLLSQGRRYLR